MPNTKVDNQGATGKHGAFHLYIADLQNRITTKPKPMSKGNNKLNNKNAGILECRCSYYFR